VGTRGAGEECIRQDKTRHTQPLNLIGPQQHAHHCHSQSKPPPRTPHPSPTRTPSTAPKPAYGRQGKKKQGLGFPGLTQVWTFAAPIARTKQEKTRQDKNQKADGINNPLGGSTPPYRLRGLGRHASRLCRPGHHRGYEVSVTRVAND
jgi:hypothetical protein